jgi:tetratricopeptide (TPR) repeat protein
MVWSEDETRPLDEARIRSAWPEGKNVREIGKNLFVVSGIEPRARSEDQGEGKPGPVTEPAEEDPRWIAERLLDRARREGDRDGEAAALTDLGIIHHEAGESSRAVELLEEALTTARQLGDRSRESDVLGNLGMAYLAVGQMARGREAIERGLASARESGDRHAEKIALAKLGNAYSALGDDPLSVAAYEAAWALAAELGDRLHAARLLWNLAILHEDQGQRGLAKARARAAVELLEAMGRPEAAWFAHHLRKFREDDPTARLGGTGAGSSRPDASRGGAIDANRVRDHAGAPPVQDWATSGPGLLRMALSATKAMVTFLGSGLKTAPPDLQQERLRTCAACEHHTGVRCRICACSTRAKARLLHEECPLGKWAVIRGPRRRGA